MRRPRNLAGVEVAVGSDGGMAFQLGGLAVADQLQQVAPRQEGFRAPRTSFALADVPPPILACAEDPLTAHEVFPRFPGVCWLGGEQTCKVGA